MCDVLFIHGADAADGVTRYGRLLEHAVQSHTDADIRAVVAPVGELGHIVDYASAAATSVPEGVTHLQFVGRHWAPRRRDGEALPAWEAFASQVRGSLVLTMHDVPVPRRFREELRFSKTRRPLPVKVAGALYRAMRIVVRDRIGQPPYAEVYRAAAARADRVVVCSDVERDRLGDLGVDVGRVTVIPHIVEDRDLAGAIAPSGHDGHRTMVMLGFIYGRKGYHHAVDALPHLPDDVYLVCAGGAPAGADLDGDAYVGRLRKRADELGVAHRLQMTGYLSEGELTGWIRDATVPLAPFVETTASGSLASWWSGGRRPVVTRSRYLDAILEMEPGLATPIPGHSGRDIARAVAAVLDRPEATRGPAPTSFSSERIGRELATVYGEVCPAGSR